MIRRLLGSLLLVLAAESGGLAQEAPPSGSPTEAPETAPSAGTVPSPAANVPSTPLPTPSPAAEVVPKPMERLESVLGTLVHGQNGSTVGRLVDVLVDKSGAPREAVLDAGGFLGVGSRRIVVPWQTLHFDPENKDQTIAISMTSDEIKAAPEYKGASRPPPTAAPAAPTSPPAPGSAPGPESAASQPPASPEAAASSSSPDAAAPPAPVQPAPAPLGSDSTPAATGQ